METIINPKTKELLFNKGWRYKLNVNKHGIVENSLAEQKWNEGKLQYVDIDIFQVVMWLYEKHGIWIQPFPYDTITAAKEWTATILSLEWGEDKEVHYEQKIGGCNSPTEAYEAAIEYVLTNLI